MNGILMSDGISVHQWQRLIPCSFQYIKGTGWTVFTICLFFRHLIKEAKYQNSAVCSISLINMPKILFISHFILWFSVMYMPVHVPAASCSHRPAGGEAGQQVYMVHKCSGNVWHGYIWRNSEYNSRRRWGVLSSAEQWLCMGWYLEIS